MVLTNFERYIVLINKYKEEDKATLKLKYRRESGGGHTISISKIGIWLSHLLRNPYTSKFKEFIRISILIIFDKVTIYNLIYFIISSSCVWYYEHFKYFYGFLLLDIVNLSDSLRNILKSITLNASNLI